MDIKRMRAARSMVGLCLFLSACRPEADAAADVVVADSAGIPVVVNPALPAGAPPAWRLSDAPTLELGLADGPAEYLFTSAYSGVRLPDGTLVIANAGSFELRFYDSTGKHLRTVGREGDGPGEYRNLRLVGAFAGDSLMVYDSRLRRATIYGPDGTLARSYTLSDEQGLRQDIGVLADGSQVVTRLGVAERVTGVSRDPRTVEVLNPDGTVRATLGVFPAREASVVAPPGGGSVSMSVLFGRGLQYAAAGDRVILATTDAYSLRQYDADGKLVRVIRSDEPRKPVDPADRDTMFARLPRNGRGSLAQYQQQAIDAMPRYDTMPAFTNVLLDRSLNLWVQDAVGVFAETAPWQVFDPDGVFVATIEIPRGIEIMDIGEDYLLGNVRDVLGVERIRLYALEKG